MINNSRPTQTVWILEPDAEAFAAYKECLGGSYLVQEIELVTTLLKRLQNDEKPDALIAETNSEGGHIIEYLNRFTLDIPVIVSTSHDSRGLIEQAFESGCKDVLVKPISRNELLVKLERALNSAKQPLSRNDDKLHTDQSRMRVTVEGKSEQLTPKEMQIVVLLKKQPQSRNDIMTYIWEDTNVSRKAFDVHLFHLRRKLDHLGVSITLNKDGLYSINIKPEN